MCDCSSCSEVKKNIGQCLLTCEQYEWLLNEYVLDFYSNEIWNKLPPSWRNYFDAISTHELADLLNFNTSYPKSSFVCPLSLLALRKILKEICLTRKTALSNNIYRDSKKHTVFKSNVSEGEQNTKIEEPFAEPKLKNIFWRNIKLKKRHEISALANVCSSVSDYTNCKLFIDCGSGLGHLSRILAYKYGFKVISLESQETLTEESKKLDLVFEKVAHKYISNQSEINRPIHLTVKIDENTNINEILQNMQLTFPSEKWSEFGIVGLHPCGDLAPILLNSFKNNENCKFICIVGCCYMKLTTEGTFIGYPLSNYLLSKQHKLSYIIREMSCHAIETFIERLYMNDHNHLKIHSYRAALEKIIIKHWPKLKHSGLCSIKFTDDLSFKDYCEKAIRGKEIIIPEYDIDSEETKILLSQWKRVLFFASLRILFAPLVETVIILDRFLYLTQLSKY